MSAGALANKGFNGFHIVFYLQAVRYSSLRSSMLADGDILIHELFFSIVPHLSAF